MIVMIHDYLQDDSHDKRPALTRREPGWRKGFPVAVRRLCQMGSPCQPEHGGDGEDGEEHDGGGDGEEGDGQRENDQVGGRSSCS